MLLLLLLFCHVTTNKLRASGIIFGSCIILLWKTVSSLQSSQLSFIAYKQGLTHLSSFILFLKSLLSLYEMDKEYFAFYSTCAQNVILQG